MSLTALTISGYRSIETCRIPIEPLTVIVGPNGVGKTNVYRAMALLKSAAEGSITRRIAEDGGVESVLWAGSTSAQRAVRLSLAAEFDSFDYRIEIGLSSPTDLALSLEPQIREERLMMRVDGRKTTIMQRDNANVWLMNVEGERCSFPSALLPSESVLAEFRDVHQFPALEYIRRELASWRFYHGFRTDPAAPLRKGALAIATPTLACDGSNLAALLATTLYLRGDAGEVRRAVADAFPGTTIDIEIEKGHANLALRFPDQQRAFAAHELSDGTLRYLCLVGALCGMRLPPFIALNEPETSLHPDLIQPLARLVTRASLRSRLWVVTHSEPLGAEIEKLTGVAPIAVVRRGGGTEIQGRGQGPQTAARP